MVLRKIAVGTVLVGLAIAVHPTPTLAQPPVDPAYSIFDRVPPAPSPTSPSDLMRSMPTPAELRQQRALYQTQQRVARLEAAAWLGQAPLRPSWNSVPMMSSRYPDRRVVYVPVFVP